MAEKFTEFDVADLLTSGEAIKAFLAAAMETGDAKQLRLRSELSRAPRA